MAGGGVGVSARGSEGSARATSRASGPTNGPRGDARAHGREAAVTWARVGPAGGKLLSLFFFLISITHFIFVSFSFCTKLFSGYSRCWKIKSK